MTDWAYLLQGLKHRGLEGILSTGGTCTQQVLSKETVLRRKIVSQHPRKGPFTDDVCVCVFL